MASATGIPDVTNPQGLGEEEPLLGGPGDASQKEGKPLYYNLFLGNRRQEKSQTSNPTDIVRYCWYRPSWPCPTYRFRLGKHTSSRPDALLSTSSPQLGGHPYPYPSNSDPTTYTYSHTEASRNDRSRLADKHRCRPPRSRSHRHRSQ